MHVERPAAAGCARTPSSCPTLRVLGPSGGGCVVEFTFVSSIYVFDCGHSTAVRTTRPSEPGAEAPCLECSAERLVVEVITLA